MPIQKPRGNRALLNMAGQMEAVASSLPEANDAVNLPGTGGKRCTDASAVSAAGADERGCPLRTDRNPAQQI